MRPRVTLTVFVFALLVLGFLVLFRPRTRSPLVSETRQISALSSSSARSVEIEAPKGKPQSETGTNSLAVTVAQPGIAAKPSIAQPLRDEHQAYVDARIAQLQDLAMENDSASLDTILSELANNDPEIRRAAVEATTQFGSRDAIPRLLDAAAQTDDPKEKAALNEAAEFLKLPSLTEVLAKKKSATPL